MQPWHPLFNRTTCVYDHLVTSVFFPIIANQHNHLSECALKKFLSGSPQEDEIDFHPSDFLMNRQWRGAAVGVIKNNMP